mgnify:CR=1 FL=1
MDLLEEAALAGLSSCCSHDGVVERQLQRVDLTLERLDLLLRSGLGARDRVTATDNDRHDRALRAQTLQRVRVHRVVDIDLDPQYAEVRDCGPSPAREGCEPAPHSGGRSAPEDQHPEREHQSTHTS